MKENRKSHRASILDEFAVYDKVTGEALGHVRNISEGGIMVAGKVATEPEKMYRLSVQLPKLMQGRHTMEVSAGCQWHVFDEERGVHKAGFKFASLSGADQELILMLQTEYEFETSITSAHL